MKRPASGLDPVEKAIEDIASGKMVVVVDDEDEILAVTRRGVLIRTPVADISMQGRAASGVKVISPDEGDQVASIALVTPDDDDPAHGTEDNRADL